jgi:cytoplasmic iron level regulating protein YaaA (DUF328/UPF0246 family)
VLILLPPSEGKTAPARGKPVDLSRLTFPQLTEAREALLRPQWRDAPAAAAEKVYTGVLYQALDVPTLPADAHRYLKRAVLVFSALWGVVGLGDRIPAYKLPAGAGTGTYWRRHLPAELGRGRGAGLVVDLRSGPYASMWNPPGDHAVIRVLHERDGTRKTVSHFNKATKGRLVRDLAISGARPRTVDELVGVLRDLKHTIEREEDRVDVIVNEL